MLIQYKEFNKIPKMLMVPHYSGSGHRGGICDPFGMDVFDPFKEFNRHALSMPSDASSFVNTSIDWRETPEAHIFKADLPGMKKEEVKVELEDDRVLQIRGERIRDHEQSSDRWHRVERSSGKFVRRFRLPENAKMDQIQASMEHGVLTVTVPKEVGMNRGLKAIEISG